MLCPVHCAYSSVLPHSSYACTCSVHCRCLHLPCPYICALCHCQCTSSVRHACCFRRLLSLYVRKFLHYTPCSFSFSRLCPTSTVPRLTRLTHAGRGTPLRACHFYVCLFLPFLFLTWSPQSREVFKSKMMRSFTLSPVLPSLSFDPYLIWATWRLRGWHKAAHTGTSDHFCGTPKCNWWGESALVWR